tara:strand:+ start:1282 stop:1473 length:192 start_codon:yes stop_codon:yes gene_type:complete
MSGNDTPADERKVRAPQDARLRAFGVAFVPASVLRRGIGTAAAAALDGCVYGVVLPLELGNEV